MSKSITIDNTLDSNLKPLKIDNKLTGIELSDDELAIRNETKFDKNLSLAGAIKFEQEDAGINFGNQLSLSVDTSLERLQFYGTQMMISGSLFANHADTDVKLLLIPDGTGDSTITFYEDNVSARFAIGHDATDTTFQIVSGTTMGTNTLLSMAQTGAKTFNCTDGNTDLKLTSSANTNDYCSITVGAEGATTIATVDADTAAANLTVDVDGDITLDADGGEIYLKDGGTTFGVLTTASSRSTLQLYESAGSSTDDYVYIQCQASGSTKFVTNDAAGADAELEIKPDGDLTIDAQGDISLDTNSGNFIAKKAGTEFSVANSAYAGMILGYQMIGESAVHGSYTFTTSYAVPDSAMNVKFVAPPSGVVEIAVQFGIDGSSNRYNYIGLSDNATYNSIGNSYEVAVNLTDESDQNTIHHIWVVTGLTAGTAYQYWLGAKSSHASGYIRWGGTASGRYQDFIMKAVALPAATTDYAVYD